jgi:hypothetical protein
MDLVWWFALPQCAFIGFVNLLYNHAKKPTTYRYPPLPPGNGNIRLLRLMPNGNRDAGIKCQLFNYSLGSGQGDHQENHLYEALSYVWGDPIETSAICIDNQPFNVTKNLHSALSRLRNHALERILWIDAICIDQTNQKEKQHQIRSMANIYTSADRVIIWLGDDADDSQQALKDIRVAANEESIDTIYNNRRIITLLQRPWFERIWVRLPDAQYYLMKLMQYQRRFFKKLRQLDAF